MAFDPIPASQQDVVGDLPHPHNLSPDPPSESVSLQNLPIELITEIFSRCLPSSKFHLPKKENAPMLLTQVNATWRRICLLTPTLWSSLQVPELPNRSAKSEDLERLIALVHTWLSRSGTSPLSISIKTNSLVQEPIFDLFNGVSARWEHVRVQPPCNHLPLRTTSDLPLLKSFELLTSYGLNAELGVFLGTLRRAPAMRQFTWINEDSFGHPLELNWSTLTQLTLSTKIYMADCINILDLSPNLIQVAFQNVRMHLANVLPQRDLISLPNLRSFGIITDSPVDVLFNTLVMPVVRELVINTMRGDWQWPQTSFLSFLGRSHCQMETLVLYYTQIQSSELLECLQHVQGSLTSLTVQDNHLVFGGEIVASLTKNKGLPCLCPKLEFLALFNCIACSTDQMREMIQSRSINALTADTIPPSVARLKVFESYDSSMDSISVSLLESGYDGPVFVRYSSETRQPLEMAREETIKLKGWCQGGLVLPMYHSTTGQFWELVD